MSLVADERGFGVYVHVPYCQAVCPYCDFNVYGARGANWPGLERALVSELSGRAPAFSGHDVYSVYFGGGTPSLAPPSLFASVLASVRQRFAMRADAEVTCEVDPATLDEAGFAALRAVGVNRLSLGWQSTHDRLLTVLGRNHDAAAGALAFRRARAAGFDNVSMDLIFAVPTQTMDELERDLDAVLQLGPEHVSLYALTFHEGTPFERWRKAGKLAATDEDLELAMMLRIEERLGAAGYEHYEVSNYARPGKRAVHNALYWAGARYLGLGPGAHSFDRQAWERGWRWENVRRPRSYFEAWTEARAPGRPGSGDGSTTFVEELAAQQLLAERFLVGLRRADGVDLAALELGARRDETERAIATAVQRGWLERTGSRLVPTSLGLANADTVAELFF